MARGTLPVLPVVALGMQDLPLASGNGQCWEWAIIVSLLLLHLCATPAERERMQVLVRVERDGQERVEYKGYLRTGEAVAIKVQRPECEDVIGLDIYILHMFYFFSYQSIQGVVVGLPL